MPDNSRNNINLVPEIHHEEAPTTQKQHIFNWIIKWGTLIVVGTEIIVIAIFGVRTKLENDLLKLIEKVEAKDQIIKNKSDLESIYTKQYIKIGNLERIINEQKNWGEILETFNSTKIPTDVTLTELEYSLSLIKLSGKVQKVEAFGGLIQKLVSDDEMETVTLSESKFTPENNLYEFTLEIGLPGT